MSLDHSKLSTKELTELSNMLQQTLDLMSARDKLILENKTLREDYEELEKEHLELKEKYNTLKNENTNRLG